MKVRNPVLESWFYRALTLKLGEELFIPCEDRKDRTKMVNDFDLILKKYAHIEPIIASQLVFRSAFRDGGHWIRVLRKPSDPSVVFKKHPDGTVTREVISTNFEIKRMIDLMLRDNWSKKYIIEFFDNMTEEELEPYFEGE